MSLGKIVTIAVGLFMLFVGLVLQHAGKSANDAFAADPTCLTAITVETPPRSGKTCRIVAGTVDRVYTDVSESRKSSQTAYHVVVEHAGDPDIDVTLGFDDPTPIYENEKPGETAVVEELSGEPMLIATAAGTVDPVDDPRTDASGTIWVIVAGLVAIVLGIFLKAPRRGGQRR